MIKIRRGIFETNSSSSHTLVLEKDFCPTSEQFDYLKNLSLKIDILHDAISDEDFTIYDTIELKLSYLYTAIMQIGLQCNEAKLLFDLLKKICPRVIFMNQDINEYVYSLEDLEYLFDDEDFNKLLNEDNLIKFLLNGIVYNIDRDTFLYDYDEVCLEDKKDSYLYLHFSG